MFLYFFFGVKKINSKLKTSNVVRNYIVIYKYILLIIYKFYFPVQDSCHKPIIYISYDDNYQSKTDKTLKDLSAIKSI